MSAETPIKLPKEILDKAEKLGVYKITLHLSGGSDESYLEVELNDGEVGHEEFESKIEDWVWKVYDYSGAGDGNDYGDDIVYDLVNKTASSTYWQMERADGDTDEFEFDELEEG